MKTRILTTITAATLVMTTMLPTLAAHAATTTNDPTAVQVTQGLLSVYATQQVWPWGLQSGAWGKYALIPGQWYAGYTPEPTTAWYGLSLVFPNKPSSEWPQLLGMTNVPSNQPITAGTLAQWLYNWEKLARIPHAQWQELKNQPSQDPYTLMSDYNMFWGTNFTSAQTVVTAHDLTMVERNIVSVDQCYRVLAPNKIQVLVPMITDISTPVQETKNLATMDSVIVTFPGHNLVNVTVGNTTVPIQLDGTEYLISKAVASENVASHATTRHSDTLEAFFPKGEPLLPVFKNDNPTFMQAPNWVNANIPFFVFGLTSLNSFGDGFYPPIYDFGFTNGKISHIAIQGTKYNSWPYFSGSQFSE